VWQKCSGSSANICILPPDGWPIAGLPIIMDQQLHPSIDRHMLFLAFLSIEKEQIYERGTITPV
jgi:hypothetical protein